MATHKTAPARLYGLYDLAEDFFPAIQEVMSLGFSVFHLEYLLAPLPPDALSGDPPPEGSDRFTLYWAPSPGYILTPELNQALLDHLPVRHITHNADTASQEWRRILKHIFTSHKSGQL